MTAGQTYHYQIDGLQYRCTEGIEHKGITITGSEPFTVYLTNADYTHETNPGSTILRPISENIEDVYLVNYLNGSSSSRPHSFYMVVADEANTDVAVYKYDGFGLSLHREFTLGSNEVFTEDSDQDLTGYFVRASKPVAVYSGHGQAQVPVSIIGLSGPENLNLQAWLLQIAEVCFRFPLPCTHRWSYIHTYIQTGRQTGRQTDRHTCIIYRCNT